MSLTSGGLTGATLRRVLEHIEANVQRAPRLAELSAVARMSVFHFARLFKLSTGLTPHQFVLRRRIDRAKQRLTDGELPSIAAIGRDAGFRTPSNFTSAFHRATGVTPTVYRVSHAGAAATGTTPAGERS